MNPHENDTGEWLADVNFGYLVVIFLLLTVIRLLAVRGDKESFGKSVSELCESLLTAGTLVFMIIRPFLFQAYFIPSESMEPTLMGHDRGVSTTGVDYLESVHDHLFVNKLAYRLRNPEQGDIAVFKAPKAADFEHAHSLENTLIKRVVGVPGDTIFLQHSGQGDTTYVLRNGLPILEPYINEPMRYPQPDVNEDGSPTFATTRPFTLGPGQYFMMGDNRNHSNDSRYWGVVSRDRFVGVAAFRFWPFTRIGLMR